MARMWRELTAPETVLVSEIATIERIINFVAARRRLRASDVVGWRERQPPLAVIARR